MEQEPETTPKATEAVDYPYSPRQHGDYRLDGNYLPWCKPHKWAKPRQTSHGHGKTKRHNNNHVCKWYTTNTTEVTSSFYNGTLVGMNVTLYHAAMDPEGSTMAMGWDTNLDGSIDIPVSANSGFTTVNMQLSQWHDIPTTEQKITTVAFIASDALGDQGVAMLDVYSTTPQGPWSEDRSPQPAFV